jgi:hypothetical protein
LIAQYRFISWGLNKENPLYWLDQNNPLAITLTAFMDQKKIDPVGLKYKSYVSVYENPNLSDNQKANALDHIQAYQELDEMQQRIFDEKIFRYQKPSELEMSPTQKLVFESKQQGKIEGKMTAKQETLLKYLLKYYQPSTQQQQLVSSIKDEILLDHLLDEVVEHQKSLDEILAQILSNQSYT